LLGAYVVTRASGPLGALGSVERSGFQIKGVARHGRARHGKARQGKGCIEV